MKSHITGAEVVPLFRAQVLQKYEVQYYRCPQTGYIQTEKPYWLDEAYQDAITQLDIGLVQRNLQLRERLLRLIPHFFGTKSAFLDYAGGYGLFVRMMRDAGLDFYRQDPFCENLFARHFDLSDLAPTPPFALITAFEVFEHWENPVVELEKVLKYGKNILFSTELQPEPPPQKPEDWWYFSPEMGQHVSFYTRKALEALAAHFGLYFYTDGHSLHLFTEKPMDVDPFVWEYRLSHRIINRLRRLLDQLDPRQKHLPESRLQTDYALLSERIK